MMIHATITSIMCWQASIFFTYFVMSGAARQKSGQWLSISKKWHLIKQSWLKRHSSSSNIMCLNRNWTVAVRLHTKLVFINMGKRSWQNNIYICQTELNLKNEFRKKKSSVQNYDGNFHLFELCKMQIGLVSLGSFMRREKWYGLFY